MSSKLLVKFVFLVGFPITAYAQTEYSSEWVRVGRTDASCSFRATLDDLSGYPFARLLIQDSAATTVIPLAMTTVSDCEFLTYTQVPRITETPTFEVVRSPLCMSRLPTYTVTRSLSGVQETCRIE